MRNPLSRLEPFLRKIRRLFSSLAGKLTAVGLLAIVLVSFVLDYVIVETEKRHMLEREEEAARMIATSMKLPFTQILLYEETGLVAEGGLLDLYISRMVGSQDLPIVYAMVLDPEGQILSHSNLTLYHQHLDDPLSRKALAATGMILSSVGDPFNGGKIDVATPLNVSSKRFGTLRFGYSLSGLEVEVRNMKRKILVLAISASAFMIFLVVITARVMVKPIRRLVHALNSVHLGMLETMPLPDRNDELGDLQDSYRTMVDRLREEELERKKTRELLGNTEKMATIGTLAAGIAHEINSPLTGAMHSVQALRKESLSPRKRDQYLQVVGESLERIRRAVSQLLDYSTVHATNFSECDPSRLVGKTLELLDYQIGKSGIEVENRIPRLTIRADAHKLEQVLVNMVMNAIAAMPSGGKLEISHIHDGSSLTLVVADTGEGIAEEDLCRIFEPFFTTKGMGKGTGLGLAVCRKIVEQHGGRISVSSRPGEGAKFFISLPYSPPQEGTHGR
jgi:signal transduction histidine kinase